MPCVASSAITDGSVKIDGVAITEDRVFTPAEAVLFAIVVAGAVAGVVSLATGAIQI